MTHEFFMPMEHVPTITHQEHKIRIQNGRPVFYEPPELQRVRQIYLDMLSRHKPERKLAGPLALHVVWCFLTDRHPDGAWRDTKPDTGILRGLPLQGRPPLLHSNVARDGVQGSARRGQGGVVSDGRYESVSG